MNLLRMSSNNISALSVKNNTDIPWLYDISLEDTNWIITSAFMIFTMQTGFGMLESGCVSIKNEVNIMMKNVVDIVLGGLTYWFFGFSMSFGGSPMNNGFIAFGDYFVDPPLDEKLKGAIYAAFIFQLSFATTATTIVSGAMAERCNFKAYCIFSFLNTAIYCIPAGWMWGEHGFLKQMGVVDIAGSGAVHLIGGSSAMASAIMLGPRLGRYDNGIKPLPLGNPVNAVMGLFVLWWGWLAFNSGSTYGLSGEKWHYAARAAVMTMMASFGGGTMSILYSLSRLKGKLDAMDVINGILGSLVSVTAGCFLYKGWHSIIVGAAGALFTCLSMPLFDMAGIDDPVGASAVHGVSGLWGVLAVGIFAENPYPLDTTSGRSGLLNGGGWYLLGVQSLAALCLMTWGILSSFILLWLINQFVRIRMEVQDELLGADLTEHFVRHGNVGVSRALSALRSVYDTSEIEKLNGIGYNPGHEKNLEMVKKLAKTKKYRLSKILNDLTRNKKLGCNSPKSLIPRGRFRKKMNVSNGQDVKNEVNGTKNSIIFKYEPPTRNMSTADTTVSTLTWVN
ncbi:putative ammonium transporter 2 [Coccinella septempunctata]|uniref:putative ammonium transporter 2 n=1 Tax=Coccinella septempunctata TaxID=41139 RepID=UPI001D06319D|nr:putative ammonium transporter 2 [Coccinella septempunctata]